jgi:hypothetical protein
MGDPGQRDHGTRDGEEECRSDVRQEHDCAGQGADRTGWERQSRASALRGQVRWKAISLSRD